MRGKNLLWQIFPLFLSIVFLSILAFSWLAGNFAADIILEQKKHELSLMTLMVRQSVSKLADKDLAQLPKSTCGELVHIVGIRITIVLPSGKVLCDSAFNPATLDNHSDRPEFIEAMKGRYASLIRFSYTGEKSTIYAATPLFDNTNVIGVLRLSTPVSATSRFTRALRARIIILGIAVALLWVFGSLALYHRIKDPISTLEKSADLYARGGMWDPVRVQGSKELAIVAESMNKMAEQLDDQIRVVERQRNQLEAVLAAMNEGVIAVDREERIINMNLAACAMIGIDPARIKGLSLQEAVRNPEIQDIIAGVVQSGKHYETEIEISREEQRFFNINAMPLRDGTATFIGVLVVLNDITKLRSLENIRRDFVANVSHELKTPITSIKGAVETLVTGAMDNPGDARRFLDIVQRHTDRMLDLVEDLLSLAKLEQDTEQNTVALEPGRINDALQSAIRLCEDKASSRNIRIKLSGPGDLAARINPRLLEQAVVNLIDNAVKYSDPDSEVEVESARTGNEIIISVKDHGPGIPVEHQARLFERFYRIDKARSRKLGGTGLGLAIVKHSALAHGGRVSVQSAPGRGSVFSIHIPGTDISPGTEPRT